MSADRTAGYADETGRLTAPARDLGTARHGIARGRIALWVRAERV